MMKQWFVGGLIGLLGIMNTLGVVAQSATPRATPATTPVTIQATPVPFPGLMAGESIAFRRVRPPSAGGTYLLGFHVLVFDTSEQATAARDALVRWYLRHNFPREFSMHPVSTRQFGDETVAYAASHTYDSNEQDVALLMIRDGALWHIAQAQGMNADPLTEVYAVLNTVRAKPAPTATNSGAWLPTLDDMPPGWFVEPT